jgi:hypothetical protein
MTPSLAIKTSGEAIDRTIRYHAVVFNVFEIVSGMAKMVDFLAD